MTERELIESFIQRIDAYYRELDKLNIAGHTPELFPIADKYFSAAQNLGADLLRRMCKCYLEHSSEVAAKN